MTAGLVIEGFAGPGGMSESLRLAGFCGAVVGLELDPVACRTAVAAGHWRVRADVAAFPLTHLAGRVEGIVKSPPCQGFSRSGKGGGLADQGAVCARIAAFAEGRSPEMHEWTDVRSPLTAEPMRYAYELRPRWMVLEQSDRVLPIWQYTADCLERLGYSVWTGVLSAEQFGVPQTRKRAFLIAHQNRRVSAPVPTHQRYRRGKAMLSVAGFPSPVTMREALGWGLPDRPAWTVTAGGTDTGGPEVFGNANNRRRLEALPDWPGRRMTVAEAAALQSFRPGYPWQGTKSQQHQQVGNAVPPLLGAAVLRQVLPDTAESAA